MVTPADDEIDWNLRIYQHITPAGDAIISRTAGWLEQQSRMTADRRIMLRTSDPLAYAELMALHIVATTPRAELGTKVAATQAPSPHCIQWLTTREAAELAKVTERCIRKWITTGKLSARRHGWSWRIDRNDLNIHMMSAKTESE